MSPLEQKKTIRRTRTLNSFWVLATLFVAAALFWWSDDTLRAIDPQAAPLPIDILQPAIVAMVYVTVGGLFSTLMAVFYENQIKENAFGQWSRFAVLFALFFLGFCWVSSAIL